jgi:hypothetical protein
MRCSCVCSTISLPVVGLCLLVSTYRGGKYRSGAVSQVSDVITAAQIFVTTVSRYQSALVSCQTKIYAVRIRNRR